MQSTAELQREDKEEFALAEEERKLGLQVDRVTRDHKALDLELREIKAKIDQYNQTVSEYNSLVASIDTTKGLGRLQAPEEVR